MKRALITFSLTILISFEILAQQTMQLTFTAIDSTYYTQLDSIKIMNLTKFCDTMLYWNDTVLVLDVNVGLPEQEINEQFKVKAYPNPVKEEAILNVEIPEAGKTDIIITNIRGRLILAERFDLTAGLHDFRFDPGHDAMYFITFSWRGKTRYLKLFNANSESGRESMLFYLGGSDQINEKKFSNASDAFEFNFGDQLLYGGYIDTLESGITDVPLESETYTFQFSYNIPCIGSPTVEYEGQIYNTVQVFSQCWLKENLNYEAGNSWCYDDNPSNCEIYGRLYEWSTALGVCPVGWHLPSDEEWKILEGSADTQYGVGDPEWDDYAVRGYDAGKHLKSTTGWEDNGNGTDIFGFKALPGGHRFTSSGFSGRGRNGLWWSATIDSIGSVWHRYLHDRNHIVRHLISFNQGYSVRCIKD